MEVKSILPSMQTESFHDGRIEGAGVGQENAIESLWAKIAVRTHEKGIRLEGSLDFPLDLQLVIGSRQNAVFDPASNDTKKVIRFIRQIIKHILTGHLVGNPGYDSGILFDKGLDGYRLDVRIVWLDCDKIFRLTGSGKGISVGHHASTQLNDPLAIQ
jgi:hypothetical protein